jgi:transcriptional regulator with XRE-family HTH domain
MLHKELRAAREMAKMSQAELAARAGIPRNQVVRAEKGENITIGTLRKIAANLPVKELTLLDTVKLSTEIRPVHDKVYVGAMETLAQVFEAMTKALEHAQDTLNAFEARKRETPEETTERGGDVDPTLILQRLMRDANDFEKRLRGTSEPEKPAT